MAKLSNTNIYGALLAQGNIIADNDVIIKGDLFVEGLKTVIDSTNMQVTDRVLELAKDNVSPLTGYAGIAVRNYDGANDGGMIIDNTGEFRVGDVTINEDGSISDVSSVPLLARNEVELLDHLDILVWDNDNYKAIGKTLSELGLALANGGTYNEITVTSINNGETPLIINGGNDSNGLEIWQSNGTASAKMDNSGRLRTAEGISNITSSTYGHLSLQTSGPIISRDVADGNSSLIVNLINENSTGYIQKWQFVGDDKVVIDRYGNLKAQAVTSKIFRDWDNTDYFLDLSSTTAGLNMLGTVRIGSPDNYSKVSIRNANDEAFEFITNNLNYPIRLEDNGAGLHSLAHFRVTGTNSDVFIGAVGETGYNNRADFVVKNDNDGTFLETFRIKHDGKVGVGTDSPDSIFNIEGASPFIIIDNTAENEAGIMFRDTADISNQYAKITFDSLNLPADGDNKLRMYVTSAIPSMTLTPDGKVGVGIDDPINKFHVDGDARLTNLLLGTSSSANTPDKTLHLKGDGDQTIRLENSTGDNFVYDLTVNNAGKFSLKDITNTYTILDTNTEGHLGIAGEAHASYEAYVYGTLGATGSIIGTKFLDITDGNYYLDPANTDKSMNVKGDISIGDGKSIFMYGTSNYIKYSGISTTTSLYNINNISTTGEIAFRTNNTERLRIDAAGNVGFGITDPTSKVHIKQDNNTSLGGIVIIDSNNAYTGRMYINNGGLTLQQGDNSNQFFLKSDGKAGFNTINPISKVEVVEDVNKFGIVSTSQIDVGDFTGFGIRAYSGGSGSIKSGFVKERTNNYGVGKLHLLNDIAQDDTNADLTNAIITIDQNNNVGIGASSPSEKLEVAGNVQFQEQLTLGKPSEYSGLLRFRNSGGTALYDLKMNDGDFDIEASSTSVRYLNLVNTGSGSELGIKVSGDIYGYKNLYLNNDNTDGTDTYIYFGDGEADEAHYFRFDDSSQDFDLSNSLAIAGSLKAKSNLYINTDNTDGTDSYIYFGDGESDTEHYLRFDDSDQNFDLSNSLSVNGNIYSQSNLYSYSNLYLNYNNSTSDSFVFFGDSGDDTSHYLKFNDSDQIFNLSDTIKVAGNVSAKDHELQDSSGDIKALMRYDEVSRSIKFVFA